jgi:membrane dipeptidase
MLGRKIPVSERAAALHEDVIVLDCHAHFLIHGRGLKRKFNQTHSRPWFYNPLKSMLDLDSVTRGGVNALAFTSYAAGVPFRRHPGAYTDSILDRYFEIVAECQGRVVHCCTPDDIRAAVDQGRLASFLTIEGGHVFEGSLERIGHFYARGVRMTTLVHFVSNGIADSCQSPYRPLNGLSRFGREVIRTMEQLGMMVDVTHLSDPAMRQTLDLVSRPPLSSHAALRRYNPTLERNITDDVVREIGSNGGMVGIIFFLRYLGAAGYDMHAPARHAADIADLCGAQCLCVGSDLDSPIYTPFGFRDAADWPQFTQALMDVGFADDEVRGILGENFLRYWEKHYA